MKLSEEQKAENKVIRARERAFFARHRAYNESLTKAREAFKASSPLPKMYEDASQSFQDFLTEGLREVQEINAQIEALKQKRARVAAKVDTLAENRDAAAMALNTAKRDVDDQVDAEFADVATCLTPELWVAAGHYRPQETV
jgi:ABC-type transporter Mla subunit MlaD